MIYVWHSPTAATARIEIAGEAEVSTLPCSAAFSYHDVATDVNQPGLRDSWKHNVSEEGMGTRGENLAWSGAHRLVVGHEASDPSLTFGFYYVASSVAGRNVDVRLDIDGVKQASRWPITPGTVANTFIFQRAGDRQTVALEVTGAFAAPIVAIYHATVSFPLDALGLEVEPVFDHTLVPADGGDVPLPDHRMRTR